MNVINGHESLNPDTKKYLQKNNDTVSFLGRNRLFIYFFLHLPLVFE